MPGGSAVIYQDVPNSRMSVLVLLAITLVNAAIVVNFLFLGLMNDVMGPGSIFIYALVAVELVCVYRVWTRGRQGHRGASS